MGELLSYDNSMIAASLFLVLGSMRGPVIVWREDWGAKDVLPFAVEHKIDRITLHHTGVISNPKRSLEDKLRGLQTFSQREDKLANGKTKPAWPDIPYHYYISIDGRIGEGRPYKYKGDTNTEYDPTGHLLIVVEGEFGQEKPTEAEMVSLEKMLRWTMYRFKVDKSEIKTHRDFAETNCPGKNFTEPLAAVLDRL